MNNYRPISVAAKVFERITNEKLSNYLSQRDISQIINPDSTLSILRLLPCWRLLIVERITLIAVMLIPCHIIIKVSK